MYSTTRNQRLCWTSTVLFNWYIERLATIESTRCSVKEFLDSLLKDYYIASNVYTAIAFGWSVVSKQGATIMILMHHIMLIVTNTQQPCGTGGTSACFICLLGSIPTVQAFMTLISGVTMGTCQLFLGRKPYFNLTIPSNCLPTSQCWHFKVCIKQTKPS
jgi:hypothetical protein